MDMREFRAEVIVSLKAGVLDPQGEASARALSRLGFSGVKGVRQGRYFTLRVSARDHDEAKALVSDMCTCLLSNPVIEDYRIEIFAQDSDGGG